MSPRPPRPFRLGWYGDEGLGERLIGEVLAGRKTATASPAYDPAEGEPGELLSLVDKAGKVRATLRVTGVEFRRFGDFDEALAAALGSTLDEVRTRTAFANSRALSPDEEMRVTRFEVLR